MPTTPQQLTDAALEFLTERHLATCTTLRADGAPHVTPVGFTWDHETGTARVICSTTSQKAVNARRTPSVVLCSVDGRRWLSLEGSATVSDDPARVADAEHRYAQRYQQPRDNPARVVIEVAVSRVLGSPAFRADR